MFILMQALTGVPDAPPTGEGAVDQLTLLEGLGTAGITISAIMVAILVFGIWRYLLPLVNVSRALAAATRNLPKKPLPHSRQLRSIFPAKPVHLEELWLQFLDDREGRIDEEDGLSQALEISTIDPEDIFTESAVLQGYNRNMALTLAGIFTGLGILGTFLGLVAGLDSITGAQQSQLMSSIIGLLSGMSMAFYTSIGGIALSLLWLLLDRALFHHVQRRANEFFLAVRRAFPVESADRLLHRLLAIEREEAVAIHGTNRILNEHGELHRARGEEIRESRSLLQEQTGILQTLGTDLAIAFEGALNNTLNTQLAPLFESVVNSVNNLSTQLGDRQVQMMDTLVRDFQERLSQQMSGHFEQLAGALQNAAEWQERVHEDLGVLIERVQSAAEGQIAVIERSEAACDLFQASLSGLEQSHRQIGETTAHLETVSDRVTGDLTSFQERLTDQLETTARTISGHMERTATTLHGMGEALAKSVERIDAQARALDDRIEQLGAEQNAYRSANEQLREHLGKHIDAITEQVQSLNGFWLHFRDDLQAVGKELRGSVSEFTVFTADKLKEIFSRFDSEMATVVEHLGGTLADIRGVTDEMPAGIERLRQALATSVEPISEASRAVATLPQALKGVEQLATAVQGLQPLGTHIHDAAARVSGAERSMAQLGQRLDSLDSLVTVLRDLGPVSERIQEATAQVSGAGRSVVQLSRQLQDTDQRLSIVLSTVGTESPKPDGAAAPAPTANDAAPAAER